MKVKVSEATTTQLDWMVAQCEGWDGVICSNPTWAVALYIATNETGLYSYSPSTNWAQGGPIIERLVNDDWGINKADFDLGIKLFRIKDDLIQLHRGPTILIAGMRCYVASKLGDEIEVPEKLS